MPDPNAARVALFDMDGLLLDSERACMAAFLAAQDRFDLPRAPDLFLSCVGIRSKEADAIIADRLPPSVAIDAFRAAWNEGIAARLSEEIARLPRVEALLHRLRRDGVRMGVATSTRTEVARGRLDRSGLAGVFDALVGGDQVTRPKPDPEIYLLLADRMEADITACWAFEDSNPGTRAAVASGAKVVQVPDLTVPTADIVDLGHIIAPDIYAGALQAGLIDGSA